MRVVHVTPYYAPAWAFGQVPRLVSALARAQAAAGEQVSVLTTDALAPHERLPAGETHEDGVRVHRVRNIASSAQLWAGLSTPVGLRALARRVIGADVDVVHLHEGRSVEHRLVLPLVPEGAAVVLSPHGGLDAVRSRGLVQRLWDRWAAGRVLARVDHVIADSGTDARAAQALWSTVGRTLRTDRLSLIEPGYELPGATTAAEGRAARERWALGNGPVVLCLGQLTPRSELPVLVRAFADVATTLPGACLLLAGADHGGAATARDLARSLGIGDAVRFTGHLSPADRRTPIAAADVLALPGATPTDRPTIVEALGCGLPAIVGPGAHVPDIETAGAGRVLAPDAVAWAQALHAMLADPSARAGLSARARQVAWTYAWPAVSARVAAVYLKARHDRRG